MILSGRSKKPSTDGNRFLVAKFRVLSEGRIFYRMQSQESRSQHTWAEDRHPWRMNVHFSVVRWTVLVVARRSLVVEVAKCSLHRL